MDDHLTASDIEAKITQLNMSIASKNEYLKQLAYERELTIQEMNVCLADREVWRVKLAHVTGNTYTGNTRSSTL